MGEIDQTPRLNEPECREPTVEDLVRLCRVLNEVGAKYVVVGGFAIRAAGFSRTTLDIDLLVETGPENEARVFQGLMSLPDQAARELKVGDVEQHGVVRVADEILVDLMRSGCDVRYAEARSDAHLVEVDGVAIPFASPLTLWKMKQTHREKDIPDRMFLRQLLAAQGIQVEDTPPPQPPTGLRAWLRRTFGG
jgi:hypothetical protein